MKNQFEQGTKSLSEACQNASNAFVDLYKALSSEFVELDNRSEFEKGIDWVSDKLFGGKSAMPNELKGFR